MPEDEEPEPVLEEPSHSSRELPAGDREQPTEPALAIDPAAAPVVARLATQLRIARDSIEVLQITRADWPDTCLGLSADGEICGMMITPGYAVSVAASGQRYEFRTDESGQRIRLASAPLVEPGNALVTWRDSNSFSMLVVGTQRVAFGARGRPLLVAPLAVPERAKELEAFLAKYAPFQTRTPVGEINLAGVGTTRASTTEQRMIAEWAKLVSTEANAGLTERAPDRGVIWRREGGPANVCDRVVIGRAGTATAYSCRGGSEREMARINLAPSEMEPLYKMFDHTEAFIWNAEEREAGTDSIDITIEFSGDGIDPVTLQNRENLTALVNRVVRRLFTAVSGQ